jgi:hypothetical protein
VSEPTYIALPIEVDAEDVLAAAVAYLRLQWPDWEPADGNLDSWLLSAFSQEAAELREIASQIPTTIFRYYGATVANIPPIDAAPAAADSTWTMRDNAGYTIETGTQVGIRAAGDELIPFEVVNTVVIPPGSTVTSAGGVQLIAVTPGSDGSGIGTVGGPVELIDPLDFVTTITLVNPTSGGVDAESDEAYLTRLAQELTLLTPRPILPIDFSILARSISGVHRAVALDGYNPFHNWMTADASSVETSSGGWANDTNVTVARQLVAALDGIAGLSLTATAAATMIARQNAAVAVLPGETWTALASFRSAATVRQCRVNIRWYSDAGGTVLISTSNGTLANDSTSIWTGYVVTGQAPATALSARVTLEVQGAAAAEVHYADKMSLRRGATTDWVIGGTPESGNERMIAVASIDENGTAVAVGVKSQVQTLLDGLREVNFVVTTMDPTYTPVDVTFTFKTIAGYSLATIETDAEAAVAAYLNPASWGRDPFAPNPALDPTWNNVPIVRYLEMAQVINNVTGVDYITALTMRYGANSFAAADLSLPGAIPLPSAGAINGTAT